MIHMTVKNTLVRLLYSSLLLSLLPLGLIQAQKVITYPIGEFKNADAYSDDRCGDDPFICGLLDTYSPKFIFHPNEKFYPSTVEYFLERSSLRYRYSKRKTKEILPVGEVNSANLGIQIHGSDGEQTVEQIGKHQPSFRKSRSRGEYYSAVADQYREKVFEGFDPIKLDSLLWCYANYGKLYEDNILMGYQLQYWLFLPYNGSIGYHEGDWEGITVTVDTKGDFIFATYMAHGRSATYLPEQIIFADSIGNEQASERLQADEVFSHPVVFISKSMHASYPDKKVHRRWAGIIPLPADRTKRGSTFNSFSNTQLLPNRFMATNKMKWVQFAGRWGGRKSKLFNSPDAAPYKRPYYRGSWFRHKVRKKESFLRKKGREVGNEWGKLRFEPRIPMCDPENRWLMMVSRNDLREQYFAELYRMDDPVAKYHNLDLYNFDNVITGMMECSQPEDTYITFDAINYGGKKRVVEPWPGPDIRKTDKVENNDKISSLCWSSCENGNWVSFFKLKDFRGTSYFLNGELSMEVPDFNETNIGGEEITSIRYCIQEGYQLELYTQPNYSGEVFMLEGSATFEEVDFFYKDDQMRDVIQSARIVKK
jgi:hypothetical protein